MEMPNFADYLLNSDCDSCQKFCCISLRIDDRPIHKVSGEKCRFLQDSGLCAIHSRGFVGGNGVYYIKPKLCNLWDCFGAGNFVSDTLRYLGISDKRINLSKGSCMANFMDIFFIYTLPLFFKCYLDSDYIEEMQEHFKHMLKDMKAYAEKYPVHDDNNLKGLKTVARQYLSFTIPSRLAQKFED